MGDAKSLASKLEAFMQHMIMRQQALKEQRCSRATFMKLGTSLGTEGHVGLPVATETAITAQRSDTIAAQRKESNVRTEDPWRRNTPNWSFLPLMG